MTTEMECMHKDIEEIKRSLIFISGILTEDYELSEETKKLLKIANTTPLSEYIDHNEVKRRLLK